MHHLTEVLALVVVLGLGAQWLGWRLHIPTIVLLALFGILLGPVFGVIRPSAALGDAFTPLIQLSVAAILFEGGLSLRWQELRQSSAGVKRLVTVAVVLSLSLGAAAAFLIGGLSWPVAVVFGAITVVTGPTVILPLLRQARLRRRPASFLKWEGIVNDPTGALLTVVAFEYFAAAGTSTLGSALVELIFGVVAAGVMGALAGWLLGRAYLAGHVPEYLKGPMALGAALGVFALANLLVLEESGLVAATVLGIVLGNMGLPSIEEIRRFKEYTAIILVSAVFLLLSADLDPAILLALDWRGAALIAAVVFLVRPVAIGLATIGTDMTWQERVLVGWIAPRGIVAAAVAGVFGPALIQRGFAGGELLLPLVFLLILTTVVLHGFSLPWLARRLGLSAVSRDGLLICGANPWSTGLAATLQREKVPILLADTSWSRLRDARHAGLPVYFGEVLSEEAEIDLELGELGSLLAVTSNDAYNALVCAEYAPEFGRQRVFQLSVPANGPAKRRPGATSRGRALLDATVQYDDLQRNWFRGWTFQVTGLTDEFTWEDLLAGLPEGALTLLVIDEGKGVRLASSDAPVRPEPGQGVLWFGLKPVRERNGKEQGKGN